MKKKIIFGTALFIAVGLFMFTFANPNDKVADDKSSKQTVKEVSSEETTKEEQKTVEPEKKDQKTNTSTTRTISRRTTTARPVVNPVLPQTPVQEAVNNEEAAKKEAEEKARQEAEEKAKQEAADLLAYKEAAKKELDEYKKDADYSDLNQTTVSDIKTDGKDEIDNAKTKDEVDKALQDAKDLIDALDTIAPVIVVAADEEGYQKHGYANLNNYTVTDNVTASDKIKVTISVLKDGKKIDKVNYNVVGTYKITYTAVDEAGNKATATRSIKVLEVKAVGLVLKSGNEDVTNKYDTYVAGDKAKNIDVYLEYNNGTSKKLAQQACYGFFPFITCNDGYVVAGSINTSKAFTGIKTVTYSYIGVKPVAYNYKVVPLTVVSLEVKANKTSYIQGQPFDIKVNAVYNNGTVEKNVNYYTSANTSRVGKNQKAIISYKGVTTTYTYDVIAKSVVKLQVINNKSLYIAGQPLNLTVNATWNDGSVEKNVKYTTAANTNTVGYNQEGTVSYKGAEATFKFNVEARKVTSLKVITNKTNYIQGQPFDITVNATWNDGTKEENVAYTTTSNTNNVGRFQTAIVKYEGAEATFKFNVEARKVTSLEVIKNKTDYIQGQPFDITVNATWNDGTKEENVAYTTTSNTNNVGRFQTATVKYEGAEATFRFNVEARKVTSLEVVANKTSYIKGEAFDITVNATWNDGTKEENVVYTTTSNTNKVGKNQTATIKYAGAEATFKYDVISNITLRVTSESNDYIKGEKIDNITVYANDKKVTGYTITGDTSKVGYGQTATISYEGATVTYTYNVKYELHLVSNAWSQKYLEFGEKVDVQHIKYYNKNNKHVFTIGGGNAGTIIKLSTSQYNELKDMDGRQKLVVTIKEGSNSVEYIYTKVVK